MAMSFESQPPEVRQRVKQLAIDAVTQGDPCCWFETLYQEAQGDAKSIPWAKLTPHPALQDWLTAHPSIQGTAIVIGCGLGDDAEALQRQGLQVTAFDIAPTAIAWCLQRFPTSKVSYHVANLLALPDTWQNRFDLVFECRNVQALPLTLRTQALAAIASLVAPQRTLLMVTRLREVHEVEPDGPPWPVSNQELTELHSFGLQEVHRYLFEAGEPPVQHVWVEYRRDVDQTKS